MADLNWRDFASAVKTKIAGRSFNEMVASHPELNKAMLSRAINGHVISAANMLLICDVLRLEPFEFLIRGSAVASAAARHKAGTRPPQIRRIADIVQRNQGVSVVVSREAKEVRA